ncbi:aldehyde dehydrogenase family protein, partial [Salmonella enterica subsp. enterica serovar Virginia]|nr:aldehyde dehydrogenase family protein [Salmonella enterica subsp. enterica serovar Virginia]
LTGSIATGEHILRHTAPAIKRTHMELGGKAPVIVFDDADLDADVNAKIHEGESGRRLWAECVALGIDARKAILARCKLLQPFIP